LLEVPPVSIPSSVAKTEIFGQVKSAYGHPQSSGSTGPVLNRVFQKGFQAAKHVRTHTAITEGQVSIANVAVDLALNIFGGLAEARILLLGAGEIGEKTAKGVSESRPPPRSPREPPFRTRDGAGDRPRRSAMAL